MIVKKYVAKDPQEIQGIIERELGPNAMILTQKKIEPKGIGSWFGMSSPKIEYTVAIDEEEYRVHQRLHGMEIENASESLEIKPLSDDHLKSNLSSIKQLLEEISGEESTVNGFKDELILASRGLLNHFNEGQEVPLVSAAIQGDEKKILSFLVSKGITQSIARALMAKAKNRLAIQEIPTDDEGKTEFFNALKREIAATIKTSGPLILKPRKTKLCALVGPTGVGKTTTLVKIAIQYMQELNKSVGLITLDTEQIGGCEYIQALAENFGLPLAKAANREELIDDIRSFEHYDIVFIDTCGRCQYQEEKLIELVELFNDMDIEIHLTLSATTKDVDIIGAIQQFDCLPIESIIFTKLDETLAHGVLVNTCLKTGKSISYLTNGQHIPSDLMVANADEIARAILLQSNAEEFDSARQLASR